MQMKKFVAATTREAMRKMKDELEGLAQELETKNKVQEAWQLRRLAAHGPDSTK